MKQIQVRAALALWGEGQGLCSAELPAQGWLGCDESLPHTFCVVQYSKVKYTDRCAADERTLREQRLCHQSCWQLAWLVHGSDTSGPGVSLNKMFTILLNGGRYWDKSPYRTYPHSKKLENSTQGMEDTQLRLCTLIHNNKSQNSCTTRR